MSQKADLYNALKDSGAKLTTSYARYTVSELESELAQHFTKPKPAVQEEPDYDVEALKQAYNAAVEEPAAPVKEESVTYDTPVKAQDPEEMPGQRLNTLQEDEPIRIDNEGKAWFQEEVRKPAYPKPRGRRVLTYLETGVEKKTVQNGEYIETFEVAGQGAGRPAEVKITLPSYQVGIYKDPRFPFRIHCYNGREGFNLFEVQEYYGGAELVPEACKRIYVENDLCYDIRSVVRAIQAEHRQLQLMGRIQ